MCSILSRAAVLSLTAPLCRDPKKGKVEVKTDAKTYALVKPFSNVCTISGCGGFTLYQDTNLRHTTKNRKCSAEAPK